MKMKDKKTEAMVINQLQSFYLDINLIGFATSSSLDFYIRKALKTT